MIAFIIILLLVIALGVGIYFFTKDSTSEEAQEKNDKSGLSSVPHIKALSKNKFPVSQEVSETRQQA